MSEVTVIGDSKSVRATANRLVRLGKSQAEVALRVMHTETHNQFMDELKLFKDLLNDKGLPDSRGEDIYKFVQSQIYQKFGLNPDQRKAIKGDPKKPLLDYFTDDQIAAIRDAKKKMLRAHRIGRERNDSRDVIKKKVKEALEKAWEYHRDVFEDLK